LLFFVRAQRRLSFEEIARGFEYYRDVLTYEMEVNGMRVRALMLAGLDPMARRLLPDLFEPALVEVWPLGNV